METPTKRIAKVEELTEDRGPRICGRVTIVIAPRNDEI